jgi:hypothetical protein
MDILNRRQLFLQGGALTSYLLAYGCAPLRKHDLSDLAASDGKEPSKPLKDASGAWIRYPITGSSDRDIDNLLRVYGHVYSIMITAIPEDQERATGQKRTPGLYAKYLPELVGSDNKWEPFSWWRQAKTHFTNCAHGTENFIYWHRPYVFFFEKTVRKIAQAIVKLDGPSGLRAHADYYENWTLPVFRWDPATPVNPLFFDTQVFPPCPDNPETGTGAKRAIDKNSRPNPREAKWANFIDVSPQTLENILQSQNIVSFTGNSSFSGLLEGSAHGGIHVWVGGQMGAFFSPLDPIFWTHHAMVDFMFEEFVIRRRNEGQTLADLLPRNLAQEEQVGFHDVDTGEPIAWKNAFLIEKKNHNVTYAGLSKSSSAMSLADDDGAGTQFNLGDAGVGFNPETEVLIDNFNNSYTDFALSGRNGAQGVRVLRTKLQISEQNIVLKNAISALEGIQSDLNNRNSRFIDSIILRFKDLGGAIEDPNLNSLQIQVSVDGKEPFVNTVFALFPQFGPNASASQKYKMNAERAKDLAKLGKSSHAEHSDKNRGFMIDLLPAIRNAKEKIDFKTLFTSGTFVVDFALTRRDGKDSFKNLGPEFLKDVMNKMVKIEVNISRRRRRK